MKKCCNSRGKILRDTHSKNAKIGFEKSERPEKWAVKGLVQPSGRGPCENSHEIVVLCVVGVSSGAPPKKKATHLASRDHRTLAASLKWHPFSPLNTQRSIHNTPPPPLLLFAQPSPAHLPNVFMCPLTATIFAIIIMMMLGIWQTCNGRRQRGGQKRGF